MAPGGTEEQQRKSPITGSHFTLDGSERSRPGSWHNCADGVRHHGWTQGWSEEADDREAREGGDRSLVSGFEVCEPWEGPCIAPARSAGGRDRIGWDSAKIALCLH